MNSAKIRSLKLDTFDQALMQSIPIRYSGHDSNARLVPVGKWILEEEGLIRDIATWRQRYRQFFLDQSESTPLKTLTYFRSLSIPRDDRIFFIIYLGDVAIGHIALSSVSDKSAELDNLMRGEAGGPVTLMTIVEKSILSWAFKTLNLEKISLRILSKNPFALAIHAELGFSEHMRYPLRIIESESSCVLEICNADERSTPVELIEMMLEAKDFKFS